MSKGNLRQKKIYNGSGTAATVPHLSNNQHNTSAKT